MSVPYQPGLQALLRPGDTTDFFELAPPVSDAGLCVEMARVAYVRNTAMLDQYLRRVEFKLLRSLDQGSTQGFVAEGSDRQGAKVLVVAFRGTEPGDPEDLFADIDLALTPWGPGGNVHRGFARAFALVQNEFLTATEGPRPLLVTGHSLGAALATLAVTLRPSSRLYTFGSPRVGDAAFAALAPPAAGHRYVDCCDVVARVPLRAAGYAHTGRRCFIDGAGVVHTDWTPQQIKDERARAWAAYLSLSGILRGNVPTRGAADHAPLNYSSAVLGVRA